MYKIVEKRNNYGNYYELNTIKSNKIIHKDIIQIKSFNTILNNNSFIIFYNAQMQPIYNLNKFINYYMKNDSENYKLQAIISLKLLYSYLALFNVSFEKMTKKEATGFLMFIKGVSQEGILYSTELLTLRKNTTISSYLNTIRNYVNFLGYDNNIFLKKKNITKTIVLPESMGAKTINPFDINVIKQNNNNNVPSYIRISDFKKIINVIDSEYTLRDKIIVRLMFEHGLRIGEVLGLTLEDLKYKQDKNFNVEYSVELRNRFTDTREQKAKTCLPIRETNDYKDKNYAKKGIGYSKIILSSNLAEDLLEYINISHNSMTKNNCKRYNKFARADSVPKGNENIKKNYYIFLNTLGRPLSANLWNKYLRKIFKESDLTLDKEVRMNNLNHRFRHGFAMYLIKNFNIDDFDVKTLLRHKVLSSSNKYHNPTPDDVEDLQKRLIDSWNINIY